MQHHIFEPSFVVDISDSFEVKMKAIKCYETQFYNPHNKEPETFISRPEFLSYIESRSGFYGFQIHKKHAEPFYTEEKIDLDILNILK
jgi:LmbE family N-acetylglucosaminyl deacetylase